MKRFILAAAGFALSIATSSTALAQQTANSNLAVSLTVASECQIDTSPIAFTGYNGTVDADAAGGINVTCTNGASYSVTLAATTASNGVRTLTNGQSTLNYTLYSDASRATLFAESNGEALTGTGTAQSIPVYGRIASGQTPSVGDYSGTVTVTVTY